MKLFISFIISITLVLLITAILSYFIIVRDNRQGLDVYVDRDGQIYLNGVESTETRATQLINDPAYIPTLRYHPDSTVHYCFGQCL
jgi:hypothetical protein